MNIIHFLFAFVLILFLPARAEAESPFKGGMKYTAVRKAAPAKAAEPTEFEQSDEVSEENPTSKVWKKYQALAAGQGKQAEELAKAGKTSKLEPGGAAPQAIAPAQPMQSEKKPSSTGFASILQKYEQNKQKRSELRSIKVEKPYRPKAQKN